MGFLTEIVENVGVVPIVVVVGLFAVLFIGMKGSKGNNNGTAKNNHTNAGVSQQNTNTTTPQQPL